MAFRPDSADVGNGQAAFVGSIAVCDEGVEGEGSAFAVTLEGLSSMQKPAWKNVEISDTWTEANERFGEVANGQNDVDIASIIPSVALPTGYVGASQKCPSNLKNYAVLPKQLIPPICTT